LPRDVGAKEVNGQDAAMRKNKIHRADVMASLNTACPSYGYSIPPGEILRVSTEEMKCSRLA
jgi:hypothetical protein